MEQFTIVCQRSWRQFASYQEGYDLPELKDFLANPDPFMRSHRVKAFKEKPGDTTHVVHVRIADHDFVVKRYNIKGFRHWLRRSLLPSRASVSWCNALALFRVGIATPAPVAMIEQRFGPFRGVAFYISEYREGTIANEFFQSSPEYWTYGTQVREAIHHLTETLHEAGFTHDDWQHHNILLVDNQPLVLDLDHMRYFSHPSKRFEKAKDRDWDRLRRSSEATTFKG